MKNRSFKDGGSWERLPIIILVYADIIYDALHKFLWKILNPIMKPYYRLCYADYSQKTLKAILLFGKEDSCNFDPDEFQKKYQNSFAFWNRIDEIVGPFHHWLPNSLSRLNLRILNLGLTAEILKIRNSIDAWKSISSLLLTSSTCKNVNWNYHAEKNNSWCIAFSKKPVQIYCAVISTVNN